MNYESQTTIPSPKNIAEVMRNIDAPKKLLMAYLDDIKDDNRGLTKYEKIDIRGFLEKMVANSKIENQGDDFGKHLSELEYAYNNLLELINGPSFLKVSDIKKALKRLSESENPEAKLNEFVGRMN